MDSKETKDTANEKDTASAIDYIYRRDNIERTAAAYFGEPALLDELVDTFTAAVVAHMEQHYTADSIDDDAIAAKCREIVEA